MKLGLKILFLLSFTCFCCASHLWAAAYSEKYRPLACFMKVTMNWSADDLVEGRNIGYFLTQDSLSDSERLQIKTLAENLTQKYRQDIMSLIQNWEEHLKNPLPVIDIEKIKDITLASPTTDLRFCSKITGALASIAIAKKWQGKNEDALKLLLLNIRFSQIIAAGDGIPPNARDVVYGETMAGMSLNSHLWRLLSSGKIPQDLLKAAANNLIRMANEEVDVCEVLASDLNISRHIYTNLIFLPDFDASQKLPLFFDGSVDENIISVLPELYSHIPSEEEIKTLRSESSAYLEKIQNECIDLYSTYKNQPSQFYRKVEGDIEESFVFRMHRKTRIMSREEYTPAEIYALIINFFSTPSLEMTNRRALKKKYRIMGASLLAIGIYENGGSIQDSGKLINDIKQRLPVDVYCEKRQKCKIIHRDGEIIAYSLGSNQLDNNGCDENDLVLFRIAAD